MKVENGTISLKAVDGKEHSFLRSDINELIKFNDYISAKLDYYLLFTNNYTQAVVLNKEQYTELKEYLVNNSRKER